MSSSALENGTGVCGAVTISIGARSEPNAFWATSAEMSVAMLHRGLRLVDHDQPAGALDALQHGVLVERAGGAQVDDLALHPVGGELLAPPPARCAPSGPASRS